MSNPIPNTAEELFDAPTFLWDSRLTVPLFNHQIAVVLRPLGSALCTVDTLTPAIAMLNLLKKLPSVKRGEREWNFT